MRWPLLGALVVVWGSGGCRRDAAPAEKAVDRAVPAASAPKRAPEAYLAEMVAILGNPTEPGATVAARLEAYLAANTAAFAAAEQAHRAELGRQAARKPQVERAAFYRAAREKDNATRLALTDAVAAFSRKHPAEGERVRKATEAALGAH